MAKKGNKAKKNASKKAKKPKATKPKATKPKARTEGKAGGPFRWAWLNRLAGYDK